MHTQYFINFVATETLSNFNQQTLVIYWLYKENFESSPKEPLKFEI